MRITGFLLIAIIAVSAVGRTTVYAQPEDAVSTEEREEEASVDVVEEVNV